MWPAGPASLEGGSSSSLSARGSLGCSRKIFASASALRLRGGVVAGRESCGVPGDIPAVPHTHAPRRFYICISLIQGLGDHELHDVTSEGFIQPPWAIPRRSARNPPSERAVQYRVEERRLWCVCSALRAWWRARRAPPRRGLGSVPSCAPGSCYSWRATESAPHSMGAHHGETHGCRT